MMFKEWVKRTWNALLLALAVIASGRGVPPESTPIPRRPEPTRVLPGLENKPPQPPPNVEKADLVKTEIASNLLETVGGITESEVKKQEEEIHRLNMESSKLVAEDGGRKKKDEHTPNKDTDSKKD